MTVTQNTWLPCTALKVTGEMVVAQDRHRRKLSDDHTRMVQSCSHSRCTASTLDQLLHQGEHRSTRGADIHW